MLSLAPVSFSNADFAAATTSGQPFWASTISQTVTVLPAPEVLSTLCGAELLAVPDDDEEHADAVNAAAANAATAANVRFKPSSCGCQGGRERRRHRSGLDPAALGSAEPGRVPHACSIELILPLRGVATA